MLCSNKLQNQNSNFKKVTFIVLSVLDSAVQIYGLRAKMVREDIVIVNVNSRFLQRPQKRSRRNQIIHKHFSRTKSIGNVSDPDRQAGRQTVRRLWSMVFGARTEREVGRTG